MTSSVLHSKHTKIMMFGTVFGTKNKNYGVCSQCKIKFEFGDKIISKRSSKSKKYWHYDCATKLNII